MYDISPFQPKIEVEKVVLLMPINMEVAAVLHQSRHEPRSRKV